MKKTFSVIFPLIVLFGCGGGGGGGGGSQAASNSNMGTLSSSASGSGADNQSTAQEDNEYSKLSETANTVLKGLVVGWDQCEDQESFLIFDPRFDVSDQGSYSGKIDCFDTSDSAPNSAGKLDFATLDGSDYVAPFVVQADSSQRSYQGVVGSVTKPTDVPCTGTLEIPVTVGARYADIQLETGISSAERQMTGFGSVTLDYSLGLMTGVLYLEGLVFEGVDEYVFRVDFEGTLVNGKVRELRGNRSKDGDLTYTREYDLSDWIGGNQNAFGDPIDKLPYYNTNNCWYNPRPTASWRAAPGSLQCANLGSARVFGPEGDEVGGVIGLLFNQRSPELLGGNLSHVDSLTLTFVGSAP